MVRIISVASLGVYFSDVGDDQPADGIVFEREVEQSAPPPPKPVQPRRMTGKVTPIQIRSNKTKK